MENNNWRLHLQPQKRRSMVKKIFAYLVKNCSEVCPQLKKVAERFEKKIYTNAVYRRDYETNIILNLLSLGTKRQHFTSVNPQPDVNQNSAGRDDLGKHHLSTRDMTYADFQNMPKNLRITIHFYLYGLTHNVKGKDLLVAYLGFIARDAVLCPINIQDWRRKSFQPFKKKIFDKIQAKFKFVDSDPCWIIEEIKRNFTNYVRNLKAAHFNTNERSIEEIRECVPNGVDPVQWIQLVTQWDIADKARAQSKSENTKNETFHTSGLESFISMDSTNDKLLRPRLSRKRKDGSWSLKAYETTACAMLEQKGRTCEDVNLKANERVFVPSMRPKHSKRVKIGGFGATSSRDFSNSIYTPGESSGTAETASSSHLNIVEDES